MARSDKKILFITPGASSAGGNIFLLRFLRWFKENSPIPFLTLYGYGGDIQPEFDALSETFQYEQFMQPETILEKSANKLAKHFKLHRRRIKRRLEKENIGLIYSNTVINHQMLSMFYEHEIPILTHCHELESVIQLTGIEGFRETKKRTKHFIAVSDAVRRNLIENHQVVPELISLIYGFIPMEKLSDEEIRAKKKAVCTQLNIPENAFIVGASGTLNWRKAPEVFIQIARAVFQRKPDAPVYFLWVGGAEKGDFALFEVNFDIEKLGLQNRIFFLEQQSNPLDYYAALDVFAMVSREEPFGLVCLESAIYNTPIVCFAEAGGVPEFVGGDVGSVVPYLDVEEFAKKIIELYENPQLTEKLGRKAAEKAFANHNITSSAPKIAELIDRFLVSK